MQGAAHWEQCLVQCLAHGYNERLGGSKIWTFPSLDNQLYRPSVLDLTFWKVQQAGEEKIELFSEARVWLLVA